MCADALASIGGTYAAMDIGERFIKTFSSEELRTTDLTTAEQLVRGLTFDKYNEKISCKILTGIEKADFATVVNRIASRNEIPDEIKERILDGMYAKTNDEKISDFQFEKGGKGQVIYGRLMTVKRGNGTFDLAYAVFNVQFKLSQMRIEEQREKKFLCFTIGSYTVIRMEDRNLSQNEQDNLSNFYRAKALQGFKKEYNQAQLTEG